MFFLSIIFCTHFQRSWSRSWKNFFLILFYDVGVDEPSVGDDHADDDPNKERGGNVLRGNEDAV